MTRRPRSLTAISVAPRAGTFTSASPAAPIRAEMTPPIAPAPITHISMPTSIGCATMCEKSTHDHSKGPRHRGRPGHRAVARARRAALLLAGPARRARAGPGPGGQRHGGPCGDRGGVAAGMDVLASRLSPSWSRSASRTAPSGRRVGDGDAGGLQLGDELGVRGGLGAVLADLLGGVLQPVAAAQGVRAGAWRRRRRRTRPAAPGPPGSAAAAARRPRGRVSSAGRRRPARC